MTRLIEAAKNGKVKEVKEFIQNGDDINENDEVLYFRWWYFHIPTTHKFVILYGLFTNFYCNQDGYTAMMNAAMEGHKDIVEYLVGQGAAKDIKNDVRTNHVHVPSYVCR